MNKRQSANIYVIISILMGYLLAAVFFTEFVDGTGSALNTNIMNIVNGVAITVVPIIIFGFADKNSFAEMFRPVKLKKWPGYIFILPVAWCTATYLNTRLNILLNARGIELIEQLPPSKEPAVIITGFILTCIMAPILEEMLYRGVVLSLLKGYGKGAAVAISTMIFALAHGSITVFVSPLILGLVLGYITLKSESIFPAIFIHFGCNLISWLIMNIEFGVYFNAALSILMIVVGSAGAIWALLKGIVFRKKVACVLRQIWEYVKNPLWIPIVADFVIKNYLNHG